MRINNTYTLTYVYDNILITTSDRLDIKIRDTKQNRDSTVQYLKQIPEIVSIRMYCNVYQDECLICKTNINPRFGNLVEAYYPLMFMDLKLVKPNQIK